MATAKYEFRYQSKKQKITLLAWKYGFLGVVTWYLISLCMVNDAIVPSRLLNAGSVTAGLHLFINLSQCKVEAGEWDARDFPWVCNELVYLTLLFLLGWGVFSYLGL